MTVTGVTLQARRVARAAVSSALALRAGGALRRGPLTLVDGLLCNRIVPWVARTAFADGVQEVNGVRLEVPRPPAWGGGGEFHMALGTYERTELAYVLERLAPGDTFLDVGAHVGYFTLPAARRVGPRGRVIAVEPCPQSAALLRRNVGLNAASWVEVVEGAASDRDGTALLRVSGESLMWNTLCVGALNAEAGTLPVATRSLDSILAERGWPAVAGIKLDVEGAESAVLRGAAETLARNPGVFVLFEIHGGNQERKAASLATLRFLAARGFRFRRLTPRGVQPPTTADALAPLLDSPRWQDALCNVAADRPVRR